MKLMVLKIVFLAVVAHSCKAEIIVQTSASETVTRLYETLIDVLVECYANGSKTIGIVGDSDGIVLKTLWRKHFISASLVDRTTIVGEDPPTKNRHELEVFVIVSTVEQFIPLMSNLFESVWFNHYAKFLILSPSPDKVTPFRDIALILFEAWQTSLLNTQYIYFDSGMNVMVIDFNPYTAKAPQQWIFNRTVPLKRPFHLFHQVYRKGEQTCEALDFPKTMDLGGYPFEFIFVSKWFYCRITKTCLTRDPQDDKLTAIYNISINQFRWFIDNIQMALNASVVFIYSTHNKSVGILLTYSLASDYNLRLPTTQAIYTFDQLPIFVVTQHTAHKTQLEKVLSVIDEKSRIGMYFVYLITFFFFKFFLHQAVMPAVLNLVRLTCNTGLPKLPNNLAPTIYLACLLMFVINLQAIYTGNLASFLTQTIAYPHVNTRADIAKLGYTVYSGISYYNALAADPILDGRVVKLSPNETCVDHVLRDSLAACPGYYLSAIRLATLFNLHVSRDPIQSDYTYHAISSRNPLGRRVQDIVRRWHEAGLRRPDQEYVRLQSELVDDHEVKKNVVWRVMNFSDLRFAFVILGIGLSCSLLCFIMELLIPYVSSKYAKRRDRVRPIMASGVTGKNRSWFSPLKLRFRGLRLFSRRHLN